MGQGNAKAELEDYRKGYPKLVDNPSINQNYLFYSGKIKSKPDGDYIDNIHNKWWGKIQLLESHHGYIQWLFPIRESAMNSDSEPLQLHEIEKIKADPECMRRYKKSYLMMLHFFGCQMKNEETGEITRHENYKQHYQNLISHPHNFLKITRILKSLGEFGFEHYKKAFLEYFMNQIWVTGELRNCSESCEYYWVGTLKDDKERAKLEALIIEYKRNTSTALSHSPTPSASLLNPATSFHSLMRSSSSAHYTTESSSSEGPEEDEPIKEEEKAKLQKEFCEDEDEEDGDVHGSGDDNDGFNEDT